MLSNINDPMMVMTVIDFLITATNKKPPIVSVKVDRHETNYIRKCHRVSKVYSNNN